MKTSDHQNLSTSLRDLLRGRVCIVGVGNRRRGDDGLGPRLIDARPAGSGGVWIDAGITPENLLEPIVRKNPNTVLIVDAVAFGGLPGECRLMDATAIETAAVSTHTGSLRILSDYLQARTGGRIHVLGIQPERIDTGEELSPAVEATVRDLSAMLSRLLATAGATNSR